MTEGKSDKASAIHWLVLFLFAVGMVVSIVLVRYSIAGLPLRTFFMIAAIGVLAVGSPQTLVDAARDMRRVLLIVVGFLIVGLLVSLIAGTGWGVIIRQIIEIHVQALISLFVARSLVMELGLKPVVFTFLGAWAVTAVFAVGQAVGLNFAWAARASLGDLMHDLSVTRIAYEKRERALGLSYTPIHLATQTCLAVAAFYALRIQQTAGAILRRIDMPLLAMVAVSAIVCIASGNRSPLLGLGVFGFVYLWKASRRAFVLALPLVMMAGVAGLAVMPMLDKTGVRVASTDDGSAEARGTLRYYGFRLFQDKPFGYGLGFDSTDYAYIYSDEVIHMDNPYSIRRHALHNYYLAILNKYGVLIFGLLFLAVPKTRSELDCWVAFLPYIIHIYYHNDGPFQGDFFIWYMVALFGTVAAILKANEYRPIDRRRWTRAYRARRALGVGRA